jgi:Flp pilus assembly protein CpaB
MRSRGLVVAIAVVLAVLAAVGVIVYTNQVKNEAETADTVPVIVANQDIAANTALDPLVAESGFFEEILVPTNALVDGAVTSTDQLAGQTTAAPIFAREQIPVSRLSSGAAGVSFAGVSKDHIGVAMTLDAPRAVNGLVQQGSNVAIYATFGQNVPVTKEGLKTLLSPQAIQNFFNTLLQGGASTSLASAKVFRMPFDVTLTLVPSIKVLAIQNPQVDETGRTAGGSVVLAFDALPEDARNIIFANENATLWLGLLPPQNADGYTTDATIGIPYERIVGELKK